MDWGFIGQMLLWCGIPSAIVGIIIKRIEKKREEHDKNLEQLVLMMLNSTRANTILCKATAEAVRDGQCNGNMTAALETVDKVALEEKKFLLDKSIKYIFE
jgi:hypothetical protein